MSKEEIQDAVLKLSDKDDFVKLEAENTIAMNMPEALDVLHEEVVKKEHPKGVKLPIISLLRQFNDPASIEIFAQLLHDQNKWVRRESSSALSEYGEKAHETLLKLADDSNWRARGGAIWALAKNADESMTDVFIKAANDERSFVRSGSVFGLGKIGTDETMAILQDLADNDESGYIQYNARAFINGTFDEDEEEPDEDNLE